MINKFKTFFDIKEDEEELFYDMVYLSRDSIDPVIIQYLIANPDVRKAILIADNNQIQGKRILKMIENLQEDEL
jgi:hypothetical protein